MKITYLFDIALFVGRIISMIFALSISSKERKANGGLALRRSLLLLDGSDQDRNVIMDTRDRVAL